MKLPTFLLVTGIAAIIVAGCTVTQLAPVLVTPQKDTEAAQAIAVTSSASPVANDPDGTKFTSTPTLLRPTASASRVSRPTLTSTPIAPPTVTASAHITLTLTLKLNKNTYNLKEPVTAMLRLTNSGNKSVLVHKPVTWGSQWYPIGATVYVWLFDPNGDPFTPNKYIDLVRPTRSDYDTLDPNESIETTYDLRKEYELVLPGAYSIQLLYQNKYDPKSSEVSWKGEVWSNAVIFTVKP